MDCRVQEVVNKLLNNEGVRSRTVAAVGSANVISGFMGGMGGGGMIGLSSVNCMNGGRGRLATILSALGVLACTAGAYPVLNIIPISALVGECGGVVSPPPGWAEPRGLLQGSCLLWCCTHSTGDRLACWLLPCCLPPCETSLDFTARYCSIRPLFLFFVSSDAVSKKQVNRLDVIVIVVVTVVTVFTNLAYAVLSGVVLSALSFAYSTGIESQVHHKLFP